MKIESSECGMPNVISSTTAPSFQKQFNLECIFQAGDWSQLEPIEQLTYDSASALEKASLNCAAARYEIAVILSNDQFVQELNWKFRKINKKTNVLSFPQPTKRADVGGIYHIGDVILACETVKREAIDLNLNPRHHFTHLLVHGVLHLLGYDHEDDKDAETMEQLEIDILDNLGIINYFYTQE
ncbi:MAG: Endoribonuclease YbeY [Hyphomicrobiaceae bacterium hypho_1]